MIKKLRLKFVLVFLVLVVSVFITSSCYALNISEEVISAPVTSSNFLSYALSNSSLLNDHNNSFGSLCRQMDISKWSFDVIAYQSGTSIYYMAIGRPTVDYTVDYYFPSSNYYLEAYDIDASKAYYGVCYVFSYSNGAFSYIVGQYTSSFGNSYMSKNISILDATNVVIKSSQTGGSVLYEPKATIDTSFNYSLDGIKRGQVKLTINNLDSSLRMYGYVGCENNFDVGDILDTNSISSYLRLLSMYSDNSDLYCTLYEGEKLTYYIVDENNIILDIGYISELAEGYFLYGFPINDGVDFVFLNNGQVYWNNELTFKYQVDSGSLLTKNEIVSTGSYSYIESNKTSAKIAYNGFVYDSNGDVISSAITSATNNLSSLYMKEVNTNYLENSIGWNKSCYWLQSIVLSGTDSSGNDIDFSNYSVRWSIPTWLTVDSIEIGTSTYDKYNGVITGFSSNGVLSIQLKIYELLKNHSKDFDITLEIYNENGDLVLTYLVNSDDIVRNQILSEENNIDKPSYDITDNPGYTGGSSNKDFSNIQNWTSDDYLNLMSTDNFIWSFFKAILGNLPWWITVPMTILIFGVVIITLIRFARGA